MLFLPRNGMLVSKTASGQGVFTNVVSQFDQTLSGLVVLSAARVRQSRNERKSKHPENVSSPMTILLDAFSPSA